MRDEASGMPLLPMDDDEARRRGDAPNEGALPKEETDADASMDTALSGEEAVRLRATFVHIRNEHDISYKKLARELDLKNEWVIYRITAGRSSGTKNLRDRLDAYVRQERLSFPPDPNGSDDDGPLGIDYVLDTLGLSKIIVQDSVVSANGRYLLFSLRKTGSIVVTWMELRKMVSGRIPVPSYKGIRPDPEGSNIHYRGLYYVHKSSLFLFGHIEDTALARCHVLVPAGGGNREGVITGASEVETLFASPCYLLRLKGGEGWQEVDILGEQELPVLRARYPEAVDSLIKRAEICTSVPKKSSYS